MTVLYPAINAIQTAYALLYSGHITEYKRHYERLQGRLMVLYLTYMKRLQGRLMDDIGVYSI